MVKARTSLRDGDTIGRLRRGFSSTQNSHPVDAIRSPAPIGRGHAALTRARPLDVASKLDSRITRLLRVPFTDLAHASLSQIEAIHVALLHRTADTSATAEGWRLLFQDGFKFLDRANKVSCCAKIVASQGGRN